jgi:hypothetical protein
VRLASTLALPLLAFRLSLEVGMYGRGWISQSLPLPPAVGSQSLLREASEGPAPVLWTCARGLLVNLLSSSSSPGHDEPGRYSLRLPVLKQPACSKGLRQCGERLPFLGVSKTGTNHLSKLLFTVEQPQARGDYPLYPRVVQSSGGSHRQKSGYSWRNPCVFRNASACSSVVRLPGRRRNTRRLSRGISYRLARIGHRCARRSKTAFARTSINARSDRRMYR